MEHTIYIQQPINWMAVFLVLSIFVNIILFSIIKFVSNENNALVKEKEAAYQANHKLTVEK